MNQLKLSIEYSKRINTVTIKKLKNGLKPAKFKINLDHQLTKMQKLKSLLIWLATKTT